MRDAGIRLSQELSRRLAGDRPAYCRAQARNWASSAVWEAARPNPATAAEAHRSAASALAWSHRADDEERLSMDSLLTVEESPSERQAQAALLRCIFGNPFRPAPSLPPSVLSWNGGTVPKLAAAIYEERAFDRLPVLADSLEDAGCTNPDILGHCRAGGEHVRGCWVVDLALGKG
jgi:hypothetical protein